MVNADAGGPGMAQAPAANGPDAPRAQAAGEHGPGGPGVCAAALAGLAPRAALRRAKDALAAAGCPDPEFDARELLRLVLDADPRLAEAPLTARQAGQFAALCQKRRERFPLQYLAGRWPFLDFTLAVGPGVLIPRADSETVCLAAAECLRGTEAPAVLDLCAGSGALALGIKRLVPGVRVTALEKSPGALCYLTQNAAAALAGFSDGQPPQSTAPKAAPAVTVVEGDVFAYQNALAPASLDLILSNPPYLTGEEMCRLQPELCFEPAMALDGGPDGLRFYRHIASAYRFALRRGGALVLEVGWQQAGAVAALLAQNGWQAIETRQDLGGNPRVVLARAPLRSDAQEGSYNL